MKKSFIILIFIIFSSLYAHTITRFMVVGDLHHYSPSTNIQETMLCEIMQAAIAEQVDFIFLCGDLVISGFGDPTTEDSVLKDWRFVLDTLRQHDIRLFACRGNNDGSRDAWDSLFTGDFSFPSNGPENEKNVTYALIYDNILFIAMDQYVDYCKINQTWLDEILAQNIKPHIFVAVHEPAFKLLHANCMAAYPQERDSCWESLVNAGVKIFFCGHDHFYDHTIIDDSDGNPDNDIHQVIVGTGSYSHSDAQYDGDNGVWAPLRLFHEETNGYTLIEIDEAEVKLTWKHRISQNVFENGGDSCIISTIPAENLKVTKNFLLLQNYPNPFNPSTMIKFQIPNPPAGGSAFWRDPNIVTLEIYNLLGQKVATLVDKELNTGTYMTYWNATGLASGVYLYRLQAGNYSKTKKLILLK